MESRLIINDKTLGWLMAFIIVNNIIATTFKVEVLYYALFLLAFIYAISKSRITSINIGMLLLYSACIMSIIINNVPAFFKSWERMASFVLVTIAISPCINSVCLNRIRIRLFKYSQLLMQIVVIFSFIFYLLGINLSGRKDFSGITWQSMLIAPISANVIITTIYYLTRDKKIKNKFKYYLFLLIISAFLSLFLAASRTALIGTCAAVLLYLFMVYYNRIKTLLKVCFSIIIIMTLILSYLIPFFDNFQNKTKCSISAVGITI